MVEMLRTRPDQVERTIEVVFVDVAHHGECLISDLLVCSKHDEQKPDASTNLQFDQMQIHLCTDLV